jgi:uncharacterized protein (DUF58 family)
LLAAAVAAAAALVAFFDSSLAAFVLAAGNLALIAGVVLDVLTAPHPQAFRVERHAPEVLTVGRESTVVLSATNPSRRRLSVWLRDSSPSSLGRSPDRHATTAGPLERIQVTAAIRPSRRGRVPLGPITARAAGPLRLAGRQRTLPIYASIRVYPALPSRAEVELRLDRARLLQAGERSSNIRGGGTDFDSLREYHPDDEFRRINWRATARSSKAISNLFREERNQQVLLMLDAGRMMAASINNVSRFEYSIDAAIAVAELAARVGDYVGMTAFGRDITASIGPRGGRSQPRRILDALFELTPTLEATNYREAFAGVLSRHRRRSLLVLLTELTEESALESLFQAVPALVGRHLVIIGAVQDPQLEAIARSMPATSEEAFEKAAATQALDARERAATRLRRMGVRVIDQPPGRLAGQIADTYLRIKAFGRL